MVRLEAKVIPVFRTDENGTVVASSNGSNIRFNVSPASHNGTTGPIPSATLNNISSKTTSKAFPTTTATSSSTRKTIC